MSTNTKINILNNLILYEISSFSQFYDQVILWNEPESSSDFLLNHIKCDSIKKISNFDDCPDLSHEQHQRSIILLNGVFNYHHDIQALMEELNVKMSRTSRLVVVVYNSYLQWFYKLANIAGIRKGPLPDNFITKNGLKNIAKLTGFECVSIRPVAFCPIKIFGIEKLLNWLAPIIPGIRWLSTAAIIAFRPIKPEKQRPSLSVVIPARNERDNIENALIRLNSLQEVLMEIIFVEGHSHDGTWEEILRVKEAYSDKFKIIALKQSGEGKNNAVREGFARASSHLLTILDADLTTEPEFLNRFYEAYCSGLADFINGNRLTLPMDKEAMKPLNRLGNIFFAKALSSVLSTKISDSLCGTKLLTKSDYERFKRWRKIFGEFDPFGDFELLFPAAVLCLGIIDIPVIYRARTYGKTNISRFRHGWMLLKMIIIGLFRIKAGRLKPDSKPLRPPGSDS